MFQEGEFDLYYFPLSLEDDAPHPLRFLIDSGISNCPSGILPVCRVVLIEWRTSCSNPVDNKQ